MNIKSIQSLLIVVVLLASCGVANSQKGKLLTPEVFEKMLHETPEAQVIDVRTPEEFNDGHLKNALNMNVNSKDFENRAPYLDKTKPLFVYCYSGGRSAKACEYFEKMGFKVIYDMEGGYSAWTDANLPVEGKKADTSAPQVIKPHKKIRVLWCIILVLIAGYIGWWIRDRQQFFKLQKIPSPQSVLNAMN